MSVIDKLKFTGSHYVNTSIGAAVYFYRENIFSDVQICSNVSRIVSK